MRPAAPRRTPPFRIAPPFALLLIVAALVLVACSGGDDDEAGDEDGDGAVAVGLADGLEDACLVYTAEDAALALGTDVVLAAESDVDYPDSFLRCAYDSQNDRRSTSLLIERGDSLDDFMSDVERTEAFNDPEEIPGIADEAFWVTGGLNALFMRNGDLTLTLNIGSSQTFETAEGVAALRDANIEVGRIIIQRLRGETLGLVADLDDGDPDPSATTPPSSGGGSGSATATPVSAPATPEPTAVPTEPFDHSGDSFEGNLLARVADGDWTLGEGLVETLALFAGERDTAEVLSTPDLAFAEGTAIYAMAQDYLESGSDTSALAEVERLLDLLIFTEAELDAMVLGATAANRAADGAGSPTLISNSTATTVENCRQMYAAFVDRIADRAPEQCLKVGTLTVGPSTFHIYEPALEEPLTGWDDRHPRLVRETINETVEQTFLRLGKLPLDVRIVLSAADPGTLAAAIQPPTGSSCIVTVFIQSQGLADGDFKQSLAHEFAHCFQDVVFAGQRVEYADRVWREEGFAEYLSDVAYPFNEYERRIVGPFSAAEVLTSTVRSRTYHNYMWFSFWSDSLGGDLALIDLLRSGPTVKGIPAQEAFLAATPSIASTHHQFAEAMTDGGISNRNGGSWPPGTSLNGTARLRSPQAYAMSADFEPFGVAKWEFVVQRGSTVTTRIGDGAGVIATWRDVDEPGGWIDLNPIERFTASCDEDFHAYLVVSSTEEPALLALDVVEIEDAPCEEEPELPEIVGHDACLVGTWAIDMAAFRRVTEEQIGTGINIDSLSGDILVTFFEDGDLESAIESLVLVYRTESEGVPNRLEVTLRWDGVGGGSWNADGTLVQIRSEDFGLVTSQIVQLDGDAIAGGINPPGDDLFGDTVSAAANDYRCTSNTLEIDGVSIGSEPAIWQRR